MSALRQFGIAVATVLATCCLSSCTGSHPAAPARHARAHGSGPRSAMTLQVMPAPYQLPAAVSREVLLPAAGGLLIIGGLTPSGTGAYASAGGYLGLTIGWVEGLEINFLGAVLGLDIRRPALKLPGIGRLGLTAGI